MDVQRAIAALEAAWDVDGCLAALREGHFDHVAADECLRLLKSIELPSQVDLPRRFVSLVWYLPSFLEWQKPRIAAQGGDLPAYSRFVTHVQNCLEEMLGVP